MTGSQILNTIPVEAIVVTVDNGDEVANFLGALTYAITRRRGIKTDVDGVFDLGNLSYETYFSTDAYMFSMPDGKAIRVEIGKTLIQPNKQYRNAMFVGPQTSE